MPTSPCPRATLRARVRSRPGTQRRAQEWELLRERVGDPHRGTATVVGRQAEVGPVLLPHERIAGRLHVARRGQRDPDPAAVPLVPGQAAPGGSRGQHARHLVVAHDRGRPPRRGRSGPGCRGATVVASRSAVASDAVTSQPTSRERSHRRVVADGEAGDPARKLAVDGDRLARAGAPTTVAVVGDHPAAEAGPAGPRPAGRRRPRSSGRLRARTASTPRSAACGGARPRAMQTGSKCAASITHVRGRRSPSSVSAPPMTPASPIGPRSSVMSRSSGSRSLVTLSSSVVRRLARSGAPYDDLTARAVAVVAMDGVAQLEHHVVRDVDRERDRPHPGELEPPRHPTRCRRGGRVEAGDLQRHEPVAARRSSSTRTGYPVAGPRRRQLGRRGRGRDVVGDRRVSGDAADARARRRGRG